MAALFWILAILGLVYGLIALGAKDAIIEILKEQPEVTESIIDLVDLSMVITGILSFAMAILYLIVGLGLWTVKPWARIFAIILAIASLLMFPVGTIIGIVALYYLFFRTEVTAAFQK